MLTAIGLTILAALYFAFYKWGYKHGVKDTEEKLLDQTLSPPPPMIKSDYYDKEVTNNGD